LVRDTTELPHFSTPPSFFSSTLSPSLLDFYDCIEDDALFKHGGVVVVVYVMDV